MSWKDLDIKQKAELIKLGVQSGIKDIKYIRELYDQSLNNPILEQENKVIQDGINQQQVESNKNTQNYGLDQNIIDEGNRLLKELDKAITIEEVNNQQPIQFRQFKNGGKVDNPPFMQRILNNDNRSVNDWEDPSRKATHKLSYAQTDKGYIVYPEVQIVDGQIHDFTDPKYNHGKWDALDNAVRNSDTLRFSTEEQALRYTQEYKNKYPEYFKQFNKGGLILNNPTQALIGKVNKLRKGGYGDGDEGDKIKSYLNDKNVFIKDWLTSRADILDKNAELIERKRGEGKHYLEAQLDNLEGVNEYMGVSWYDDLAPHYSTNESLRNIAIKNYENITGNKFDLDPNDISTWNKLGRMQDYIGVYHGDGNIIYNEEFLDNNPLETIIHERTHALNAHPQKFSIRNLNIQPLQEDKDEYWDNPNEIYSRLMEFRHANKLDPKKVYTIEDIKKFKEDSNVKDFEILNRYNEEDVLKLLNDIAYNQDTPIINIAKNGGYINYYKKGGYISNNPVVNNVKQFGPGGYTDNQPISYDTWKIWQKIQPIVEESTKQRAIQQYYDNKVKYGENVPEEAKYLYDMGLLPETEVIASRETGRSQHYTDLDWTKWLNEHPEVTVGSELYNRMPEKAKAQVYKNGVTNAINKAALPTAAAIVAPTALTAGAASLVGSGALTTVADAITNAGVKFAGTNLGQATTSFMNNPYINMGSTALGIATAPALYNSGVQNIKEGNYVRALGDFGSIGLEALGALGIVNDIKNVGLGLKMSTSPNFIQKPLQKFTDGVKLAKHFNNTGTGLKNPHIRKEFYNWVKDPTFSLQFLNKYGNEISGLDLSKAKQLQKDLDVIENKYGVYPTKFYDFESEYIVPTLQAGLQKADDLILEYNNKINYLKQNNPILSNIAEESPQYLDQIYDDLISGKITDTEAYVKDLITQANTFYRRMNTNNSDDFLHIRGMNANYGKSKKAMDVGNVEVVWDPLWSKGYGQYRRKYTPKQLTLKGDVSTWWSQRYPQFNDKNISIDNNGMHGDYFRPSDDIAHELNNNKISITPIIRTLKQYLQKNNISPKYKLQNAHMTFLSDNDSYIGDYYNITDDFDLYKDKSTLGFKNGGFLFPNQAFSHKFEK